MKSPFLKVFQDQLSELNNYFSHYLFIWEQFYLDYEKHLQKNPEKLTTEFFSKNDFAPQWQVRLGLLDENHEQTKEFILKSLYLLSFSQFEYYTRDIYEFVRKIDSTIPDVGMNVQIPNDILEQLNIDLISDFDEQELLTFDYLRLRRNRIVHRGSEPNHDFRTLIRQKGHILNKYWDKELRNGLYNLDFRNLEINMFSKNEVFDLINIYRSISKKIDNVILAKIDRESLINHLKDKFNFKFSSRIKSWNKKRLRSKFSGFCNHEFNLKLSSEENFEISDVA